MSLESLLLPLIFLIGSTCFSMISKAMFTLGKIALKKELHLHRKRYFFHFIIKKLFPKDLWNDTVVLNGSTKQITRILYATTSIFYLLSQSFFSSVFTLENHHILLKPAIFVLMISLIIILGLFFDFLGTLFGRENPTVALKISYPIASLFLLIFCPLTFLFLKLQKIIFAKKTGDTPTSSYKLKDKILELVLESELHHDLTLQDKKLIVSVASFKDRIAREVMVPRIDVFVLSFKSSVHDAALCFMREGYSRIPVYKDSLDNIIGVLLYKDILQFYINWYEAQEKTAPQNVTIEPLLKPILYTPETKKISHLLQDFRSKQIHLAIVVDEYGGTEGIVTTEDILEELVGEIADEYDDLQQELLFKPHPQGGWVVDAKMNIIDIEKELAIIIPQSPEYDTLGGYIFHRAGSIPTKGWKIHHENFDLEILKSSERSVEKVRIIPSVSEEF